jgi:hypothetical protein|tara:strand:- start:50 stop:349 length:300 start_codon:yes stop_codon:yes gene_type:complete
MKKKMKSKGYAKGGTKIMKAMGGRMMKSKGGAKMMKAMGGRMMKSKGYAKGGAKMMRANIGMLANKGKGKAKRGMPTMSITEMRKMAKNKGYDLVKKKS